MRRLIKLGDSVCVYIVPVAIGTGYYPTAATKILLLQTLLLISVYYLVKTVLCDNADHCAAVLKF